MNVIGVAIISVFLGILICLLGIEYNFISVCKPCKQCDPCPKITLQDKILNTFTNTINTRLTKSVITDTLELRNIYLNDYITFFKNYPEYFEYMMTEDDIIEDLPDKKITFFLFIRDVIDTEYINKKDKLIPTMSDEELLNWVTERFTIKYHLNPQNIKTLTSIEQTERIFAEYNKIKNKK